LPSFMSLDRLAASLGAGPAGAAELSEGPK
jgi:hypothetical protein